MIIPALDIFNGKIVRLYQGSYDMQLNYENTPLEYLKKYISQGAKIIHLVDLNGAKNPKNRQIELINYLIKQSNQLFTKIQIGGGIRNTQDIKILLKLGVTKIVIGSIAITNSKIVKQWLQSFDPNRFILAIDVCINSKNIQKVLIHGWQEKTHFTLKDIISKYNNIGLKHVLCTDISKDGTLFGSNLKLYQFIRDNWPNISLQASGGITNLSEISKLRNIGVKNIIIGRAFLEEKFSVSEAISCWQNE